MIEFTARYPIILSVLFIIISAAVSVYFYKSSPVPPLKKYFLIVLKTIAIFLLLVLFIEPSLIALIKGDSEKINLVMVDNSRSGLLPGKDREHNENEIKNILSENFINKSSNRCYTFSSPEISLETISNLDSLKFNGYETNLSAALYRLKNTLIDEKIGVITLISDGLFNAGGNPLYPLKLFQAPVVTIAIGDTIQKKDAVLSFVYYEKKAFTQTENVIKAAVNAHDLQNEIIEVKLLREGSLIQTKNISVNNNNQSDEINFQIREPNPGIIRYTIIIADKTGEINYLNNRQEFLVDYIDNKTNILLISSGPGYDNAIIQNILNRINNYNLTIRTVKNPNDFYEGTIDYKAFGELSVIFLLGFPESSFSSEIISSIAAKTQEYNIPVIFFAQKNTDYKKLDAFGGSIPFVVTKPNSGESLFNSQVVASPENVLKNLETDINATPQIFRNASGILQKAGAVTLMTDKSSGEPVLISNSDRKTKSTAFLGYGLWRWNLNEKASNKKTLEKFIIEIVNITLLKDKKTKIKVYPVKDVFDYTEIIKLNAEVYDNEYKLTRNAKVTAKILQNGAIISNDIQFQTDENKYTVSLASLPIGDYSIEAEAEINNNFYARDNSRFIVDSVNTEFLITKSNFGNLRELTNNTKGGFYNTSEDFSLILDKINTLLASDTQVNTARQQRFNLWENKNFLFLVIILFSIEWVIRKRNNIP